MGDVSIKMYGKFGCVLRIERTCNDIGTFRVKRKVEHRDDKKSIYSLYQLFTIMKATNYQYLEFISSFKDHSGGNEKLTKAIGSVVEKGRFCCGLNFLRSVTFRYWKQSEFLNVFVLHLTVALCRPSTLGLSLWGKEVSYLILLFFAHLMSSHDSIVSFRVRAYGVRQYIFFKKMPMRVSFIRMVFPVKAGLFYNREIVQELGKRKVEEEK